MIGDMVEDGGNCQISSSELLVSWLILLVNSEILDGSEGFDYEKIRVAGEVFETWQFLGWKNVSDGRNFCGRQMIC